MPVDLRRAEEADVDVPALEHVAEQRLHVHDRLGPGHDDGVRDPLGHGLRVGAGHTGLVDELDVGVDGAVREVDGERGQSDPGEHGALAGEHLRGGAHDELGLGVVRCGAHACSPSVVVVAGPEVRAPWPPAPCPSASEVRAAACSPASAAASSVPSRRRP